MTNKKYAFTVENMSIIEEPSNSNFAVVSLDFFASGNNLNNMYVSEETLHRTANTIKNCPLVWKYDEVLDDIYTHDKDEVPCGFVPETSPIESKKLEDGRTMLSTIAFVWKRYTGNLVNIFKRDGGQKPVSVEMIVYEMKRLPNGMKELLDFRYEGITILGSFVTPAIPMATAKVLSFSELEKEYIEDYKKEFSDGIKVDPSFLKNLKEGEDILPPQAGETVIHDKSEENMKKNELTNEVTSQEKDVTETEQEFEQNEETEEETQTDSLDMAKGEEKEEKPDEESEEESEKDSEEETEDNACKDKKEKHAKDEEDEEGDSDEEESDGKEKVSKNSFWEDFNMETLTNLFEEDSNAKKELEKGEQADPGVVLTGLFEALSDSQKRLEKYKKDLEELKNFKTEVEKSQKTFAVEQTLRELSEKVIIPDEAREKMLEEAENYSLEDLEGWKNYCKAMSFEFAIKEKEAEGQIIKVGLPFGKAAGKKRKDLWS